MHPNSLDINTCHCYLSWPMGLGHLTLDTWPLPVTLLETMLHRFFPLEATNLWHFSPLFSSPLTGHSWTVRLLLHHKSSSRLLCAIPASPTNCLTISATAPPLPLSSLRFNVSAMSISLLPVWPTLLTVDKKDHMRQTFVLPNVATVGGATQGSVS